MTDLSHSREKDKINPVVFYTSAGLILLFSLTTILFRDFGNDSNLLIVFYVQIMPDDFVMQLHRF